MWAGFLWFWPHSGKTFHDLCPEQVIRLKIILGKKFLSFVDIVWNISILLCASVCTAMCLCPCWTDSVMIDQASTDSLSLSLSPLLSYTTATSLLARGVAVKSNRGVSQGKLSSFLRFLEINSSANGCGLRNQQVLPVCSQLRRTDDFVQNQLGGPIFFLDRQSLTLREVTGLRLLAIFLPALPCLARFFFHSPF